MGADKPADSVAGKASGRLKRLASTDWKAKARDAAATIKAEYQAGKQGDDTPAKPIWATPQQQLDGLLAVFRQTSGNLSSNVSSNLSARADPAPADPTVDPADSLDSALPTSLGEAHASGDDAADAADAAEVAAAIRGVDWAGVRAAATVRTTEASKAMKSMADHVDWGKVQPVAAQVSSALITAIATGQLDRLPQHHRSRGARELTPGVRSQEARCESSVRGAHLCRRVHRGGRDAQRAD
jgi:hypothetical protein